VAEMVWFGEEIEEFLTLDVEKRWEMKSTSFTGKSRPLYTTQVILNKCFYGIHIKIKLIFVLLKEHKKIIIH
jgi:hypothetical protein